MTDKELLVSAARAAGIEYTEHEGALFVQRSMVHKREWNPLTDDGDALRLAVCLQISVEPSHTGTFAGGTFSEANDDDPCAATRRAIVRAAAEIGLGHNAI